MSTAVVVWDVEGKLPEGELLAGKTLEEATGRGVVTLPIVADLLRRSGHSAWIKRAWGSGWKFDANRPGRGCPIVLFAGPEQSQLVWVARLVADGDEQPSGSIRVATDPGQMGATVAGFAQKDGPINPQTLGPKDEHGGWTIRGNGAMTVHGDVAIGLCIYGTLRGARVAWLAVSQVA